MTLSQLINQLNQIVAENPKAGEFPGTRNILCLPGRLQCGLRGLPRGSKGPGWGSRQRKGHYPPEMKPAVLLKFEQN
jgi:hypothetical protein